MLKNETIKRTFYAILILAFSVPAIVLTATGHETGKISGMIFFIAIGMLGYFEVLTALGYSKAASFITILLIPVFMIAPFDTEIKNMISKSNSLDMKKLIEINFKGWRPWVSILAFCYLPEILDMKIKFKFKFKKDDFIRRILLVALAFIIPIFAKMVWITNIAHITIFIYFLMIAVMSDTMGYFGGMIFGKKWFNGKKLAPKISPKKTLAGAVIGFVFSVLFGIIFGYFTGVFSIFGSYELPLAIMSPITLSLISPLGDLFYSLIKRKYKIKDFSKIIPGHGGIFDRLDSMSIVFVFGLIIFALA